MEKHRLYMLNPWKDEDGSGPFYCPDCGIVEGFLFYAPRVREQIEIICVDYPRPRPPIVEALGVENQGSPVLVLSEGSEMPETAKKSFSTGRYFLDDALEICNFLGRLFDTPIPHP